MLTALGLVALGALVIVLPGVLAAAALSRARRSFPGSRSTAAAGPVKVSLMNGPAADEPPATTSGAQAMVRAAGLTKRFGVAVALDDASFEVRAGEAVALWGGNGAGKTTALRCLLGVLPFEGRVTVAGHDVRADGRAARRRLGFVPQELTLHDDLTVEETVSFHARLRRLDLAEAGAGLTRLGLSEHRRKAVRELSGGLKQRLAVTLALLGDPPLLVLDEPTANLDAAARASLVGLLAELKAAGKTLVFTTHRLEEVLALADRVVVLERGRVIDVVAPRALGDRLRPRARLHLAFAPDRVAAAAAVLEAAGLAPVVYGAGLRVDVAAGEKGRPIALLVQAGLDPHDFELEALPGATP